MFNLIPYVYGNLGFDPFREFAKFEKEFFAPRSFSFRTDVKDKGEKFVLEAELPGFKKEDISLEINEGILTITARRNEETETEGTNVIHRERSVGTFTRSFDLSSVNEEGITASFVDGILSLDLPKKVEAVPEKRKIEIA
jgi:HSP20 family protein